MHQTAYSSGSECTFRFGVYFGIRSENSKRKTGYLCGRFSCEIFHGNLQMRTYRSGMVTGVEMRVSGLPNVIIGQDAATRQHTTYTHTQPAKTHAQAPTTHAHEIHR